METRCRIDHLFGEELADALVEVEKDSKLQRYQTEIGAFNMRAIFCVVFICLTTPLHAAEIPKKYQGVWGIGGGSCEHMKRQYDSRDFGEFPFLIVSSQNVKAHEMECLIRDVSRNNQDGNDVFTFSCSGEGNQWNKKEIWRLNGNKLNIVRIKEHDVFSVKKYPFSASSFKST
jgi:hypothetical protein